MRSAVTGPSCPQPDARMLREITEDADAVGFALRLEAVRQGAREAGQYAAGFIDGKASRRPRIPRPRGSLRAVPAVAAMVLAAALAPHHLERAAAGAAPVAAVASRPSSPRAPDLSKTAARMRERPAVELGRI